MKVRQPSAPSPPEYHTNTGALDDAEQQEALLEEDAEVLHRSADPPAAAYTVPQALKAPELRRALLTVSLIMMSQQLSGNVFLLRRLRLL